MKLSETQVAHLIALEQEGRTTASAIVADAKSPDSPLHELFDWDMAKAAEQHWLGRARHILRLVTVIVHTETQSVKLPRYVRDPDQPPRVQGYRTVASLRHDPESAVRALRTEIDRILSALTRARAIAVGLNLAEEVEQLLAHVSGLQTRISMLNGDDMPPMVAPPPS